MSISRNSIGAGSWPESPWHGYSLGDWSDELDEEAALAVSGDYYLTGIKQATQRISSEGS